jgi:uncharacterized protein
VILAAAFFVAALLYSSVGQAGGSGYLAAMSFLSVPPTTMRPTALVLNIVVASIAAARFGRAGYFSWSLFWPFAIGSIPLAYVGGKVSLPAQSYRILVGLVLWVAAAPLLFSQPRARRIMAPPRVVALLSGAAIGLLAGLTGTGGGIFLSPLLIVAGWANIREASGVSAAFILTNSVAALAGEPTSVDVISLDTLPWMGSAVLGGVIGSELGSHYMKTATSRKLLGCLLVVAGAKLALTGMNISP